MPENAVFGAIFCMCGDMYNDAIYLPPGWIIV